MKFNSAQPLGDKGDHGVRKDDRQGEEKSRVTLEEGQGRDDGQERQRQQEEAERDRGGP